MILILSTLPLLEIDHASMLQRTAYRVRKRIVPTTQNVKEYNNNGTVVLSGR
jgi:hypothetical protein